ncbi:hypothetical protein LDENG_00288800 [Lucifuga dentata]|nr:hypothetical protein LDENG_00288800 [Lucifuga dentata]
MSDSDEEFYDASDSIPDLYCEGGGDTPTDSQQTENIPPLGEVAVLNVGTETVCLGLAPNDSSVRCMIHLTYTCNTQTNSVKQRGSVIMADDTNIDVEGLHPGTEYTLSIIRAAENGKQSKESTVCVFTEPIPPERITVSEVCSDSASVTWDVPAGDVHGYVVTCCCDGESGQKQTTNANNLTLKSLKPGMKYSLSVSTQLKNRQISKPVVTSFHTKSHLESLLENLGLEEHYREKLSLSTMLQINKKTITDDPAKCHSDLPCSLGIEHFFREMGQIYEAAVSLPENDPSRQQMQHLPKLCAELLLNGFPLELVDGDASNIPVTWVTDVLAQLNDLVSPKNKILVVTVLGVQSTGKSTLLNTMFGVQFAVSSGRCTRGAFMLLIKLNEDLKEELNCDFMVIIDTEGLKSPELAQLDNSYEHDNELATLVVGLSDVTIINIAMENSTEMKDILQIVVHAFLRMKEVGKKPKCLFVHQNVSDVSAHDKNLRDRKLLLQQLNEMTQAAAKMEKREENQRFTDVMEYNPDTGNWYIPGLWNGNPPMAPVNAGYISETA